MMFVSIRNILVAHTEADELHCAGAETEQCNAGEDTDEPHRVPVELESRRLGEQHRAYERALRCVEACIHYGQIP